MRYIDSARTVAEKRLAEMEKNISAIYKDGVGNVTKDWVGYLKAQKGKLAALQKEYTAQKTAGNTKEAREIGDQLARKKASLTLKDAHYQDLTEETAVKMTGLNMKALAVVNAVLPAIYAISYNAVEPTISALPAFGIGITFDLVDESTVRYLMSKEPTLVPLKTLNKYKDIAWNKKQMNSAVLQGILQGESIDKIAERLYPIVDNNASAAIRNARTMATSAENKGRQDSYDELKEQGVVLHKVWMATHDQRTRDSHALIDGEEVDVDDVFSNGLEYPGDPAGEPEEVYNCRCTMVTRIIGFENPDGSIEPVKMRGYNPDYNFPQLED